ncbi:hypothetical protein FQR65_LT01795 [Abscondita terminalis]|nr:hypothetical protein FQR65_LT01795 [Abscondita terminalis]
MYTKLLIVIAFTVPHMVDGRRLTNVLTQRYWTPEEWLTTTTTVGTTLDTTTISISTETESPYPSHPETEPPSTTEVGETTQAPEEPNEHSKIINKNNINISGKVVVIENVVVNN